MNSRKKLTTEEKIEKINEIYAYANMGCSKYILCYDMTDYDGVNRIDKIFITDNLYNVIKISECHWLISALMTGIITLSQTDTDFNHACASFNPENNNLIITGTYDPDTEEDKILFNSHIPNNDFPHPDTIQFEIGYQGDGHWIISLLKEH